MTRTIKKATAILLCLLMLVPFVSFSTSAAEYNETVVNAEGKNRTGSTNTSRWASVNKSYIYEHNGNYVIVDIDDDISITTYSKNFEIISEKNMDLELPLWGGFLSGETYNFMVFGQSNDEEDLEKEVYRIVKYDKDFNRIASLPILGSQCEAWMPFDAGSCSLAESGNEITVHTCREWFTSSDGNRHQGQFTVILNTETMSVVNTLGEIQDNHVSHSFNQLVKYDNGKSVLVDHGDAWPRSIYLQRYEGSDSYGRDEYIGVNTFQIPGASGANCTGVYLGGFEVSKNNYVITINTIDHSKATKYDSYNIHGLEYDSRDALLITVPKNSFNQESINHIYLTDYVDNGKHATAPKLIKLSDSMFAVMWAEYNVVEKENYFGDKYYSIEYNGIRYVIVNEDGDKLTGIKSLGTDVLLSNDCHPLYDDQKIIWYYNTGEGERHICTIDLSEEIKDIGCEHNIVCVPSKEASCTSVGNNEYYKCTICGEIYKDAEGTNKTTFENELIPLLPHQGGASTCQSPGICTVCGTEYIPVSEHEVGDWITLTDSTCKVQGERIKVCRICGETVERDMIDIKEHTPGEWVTVNDSTCKSEGRKAVYCKVCGDELESETISVKGHIPGNWETRKKASCGVEGEEIQKCTACGDIIDTRTVAALEHEESEEWFVNKPPTCSQEGIEQKRCIHCGKAMGAYQKIEKLPHKPVGYWVNESAPTCTTEGKKIKKCSVCGEVAEEQIIPANGHLSGGDWIIETYPSCGGAGRKVKYCSVCGEISQEILINPEGHTSSDEWFIRKEATCTEAGELYKKCTVCGMDTETKETPALGHNYGEWIISVPATCTENGSKSRICTRCEHIESDIILSTGHDLEVEWKTVTPATCTQNGTMARFCKNCDHSLTRDIPATGHNSGDWTVTVKESCENTGTKVKRCITCGAVLETETIPATGHTIGEWEILKKADCKNTGTKVKRCTKCSNVIHSESIPVTGHEGGNWIITKVPSGGNYGIKSKFCIGCGMKLEEKIIHSISTSVVRDAVTGIEIVYPEETYEGTVTVRARNLSGSELGGRIYDRFGECVYRGYEAVLYNDGIQAVPANSYSLRLPVPEGMNHKTAEVYGIDMNTGAFFKASASYDGGYFLIEKVDAIQYVIIEKIIKLSLSQTSLSMKKGDAVQLYADTNGYNVIYTSSDTSVATVDIYGNVTAVGAGTATITATVEDTDVKAECSVEVTQSFFEMIIEAFTNFFKMLAELFGF